MKCVIGYFYVQFYPYMCGFNLWDGLGLCLG